VALLLRLINKILAGQAKRQTDITASAEGLLGRLRGKLDRFAELAVFAEDEMIPVTLIMTL
jgi:hypothetical protein